MKLTRRRWGLGRSGPISSVRQNLLSKAGKCREWRATAVAAAEKSGEPPKLIAERKMRLILLLVLAHSSQAYDGCGLAQWRCGDICILDHAPCHCGNQTTFFKEYDDETQKVTTHLTWCCAKTTCQGLGEEKVEWEVRGAKNGANCSSGRVLNLTEPCPNHFTSTQGTTNQKREGLEGNATESCNDYDAIYVETAKGVDPLVRSYTPCWEPGQNISECILKSDEGDGKYHCKSRSDENPFPNTTAIFDPTSLMKECNDTNKEAGLECPGQGCLRFDDWCQIKTVSVDGYTEPPRKCEPSGQPHFFSNDKTVCSHPTFWRDKPCTEYRWI